MKTKRRVCAKDFIVWFSSHQNYLLLAKKWCKVLGNGIYSKHLD